MFSRKSVFSTKEKNSGSKDKAQAATTAFFEKAKALFPLDKRAEAATERAWETYIKNRVAAEKRFSGHKEKRSKSDMDENGESDNEDEDEDEDEADEDEYGDFGETNALDLIRCNMAALEEEIGLDEGVLSKSFRVLACDALFEEEDEVIFVSFIFISLIDSLR
jgi:hypothetical protein